MPMRAGAEDVRAFSLRHVHKLTFVLIGLYVVTELWVESGRSAAECKFPGTGV